MYNYRANLISRMISGKLSELGCDARFEEYADYILVGALNPNKSGFGVVIWKTCEGRMECQFAKMFEYGTDAYGFNWNYNKELVFIDKDNLQVSIDMIVDEICDSLAEC